MDKFVDGWNIAQTLGEGAYGEVKLLVHEATEESVALKIVNLNKLSDARACVIKEEKIHRLLHHPNIIKLLGKREEPNVVYIFLEFAAGGELFDKIEPDIGMPSSEAQQYMKQLLEGLNYLHKRGITHRDIKPENLLLDISGNLKISDFGMATVFCFRNHERLLDKRCGTLPYVAPEVLQGPYRAKPADLWSCGIVFVAMLTGELPWNEPLPSNPQYADWVKNSSSIQSLWRKLSLSAFSLARKILNPDASTRITLNDILEHVWMTVNFSFTEDSVDCVEQRSKRMALARDNENNKELPLMPLSQPVHVTGSHYIDPIALSQLLATNKNISFSQPTQNENLLLNSELFTQSQVTPNKFQRLVKRMTRFNVKTTQEKTVAHLCKAFDKLEYPWTIDLAGIITVSTIDCYKMQLIFKVNTIDMDGQVLVDFRLSKGCGLEFKRRFIKIKNLLTDICV